jgi:hypothetical protein
MYCAQAHDLVTGSVRLGKIQGKRERERERERDRGSW